MSIIETNTPGLKERFNEFVFQCKEVVQAAECLLLHSPYLELRNVTCDFHEGVLTLRGRVPSYYLKQLAQAILVELDGVLELNNQLDVVMPGHLLLSNFNHRNHDRLPPPRHP